ncbi:TonB-dependent receptor [Fulvitalea axinellae]|uniref:TonB-dependent receptor n=1 Tax=Fulvitalea axinellae TaxID=1182444 RepID=A0AAU9CNA5_9BACT|nr:TonB-dependent receptor [Fulvitalea axinellae]
MKRSLLFLILLISSQVGFAQSISGKVTDSQSGEALIGANVFLKETSFGTTTGNLGDYNLTNLPEGNYELTVSLIGYETITRQAQLAKGDNLSFDFSLNVSAEILENVLVEAGSLTRHGKKIKDIPGSAHYISPKDIARINNTDVMNVLALIPGVNLNQEDGFGLRPNIGLRGSGSERSSKITVMEDGILMAPAPYTAPSAYYFPTMGRMKGIEVFKGASQIKYGPQTTAGAINLISTPIPTSLSADFGLNYGSFNTRNIYASAGNAHKNVAYMVEGFQQNSDGFKELDNGADTGYDKQDILAKLRVNTNPDAAVYQALTFKLGYAKETSDETYLGLTQADFDKDPIRRYAGSQKDQMNTEHTSWSINHLIAPTDFLQISTTAYRNEFKRNWYKLDKVNGEKIGKILASPADYKTEYDLVSGNAASADDSQSLKVKANNREYYSWGIQSIANAAFETGDMKHNVEFGIRYHEDGVDRMQWADYYTMDENGMTNRISQSAKGSEGNREQDTKALALHVQYQLSIGQLNILPGIRYENIDRSRKDWGKTDSDRTGEVSERKNKYDIFLPGLGLDYKINSNMSVFGGIHKGFTPGGSKDGSKPEESINYEAGFRTVTCGFATQVALYYNDYDNLLGSDTNSSGGTGSGDVFNGGAATAYGIEIEASYDPLASTSKTLRLPIRLNYTYTNAEFGTDFESEFDAWGEVKEGYQLPYVAEHQFTLGTSLEHRKFAIDAISKMVGEMRATAGDGSIEDNDLIESSFIVDLRARYFATNQVTVFGEVQNVFDQTYIVSRRPAGLRPNMPMAFNVGLKFAL